MSKRRNKNDATLDYVDDGSSNDDDSDDEWLEREAVPEDEQERFDDDDYSAVGTLSALSSQQQPAKGSEQWLDETLDGRPKRRPRRKEARLSKSGAAASSASNSGAEKKREARKKSATSASKKPAAASAAPKEKSSNRSTAASSAGDNDSDDGDGQRKRPATTKEKERQGTDWVLSNGRPVPHGSKSLSAHKLRYQTALGGEPVLVYVLHMLYFLLQRPRAFLRFYYRATVEKTRTGEPVRRSSFVDWLVTSQVHNRFALHYVGQRLYIFECVDGKLYGNAASAELEAAIKLLRTVADAVLQTHALFDEGARDDDEPNSNGGEADDAAVLETMLTYALCGQPAQERLNQAALHKAKPTWSTDYGEQLAREHQQRKEAQQQNGRSNSSSDAMNTHAWLFAYMEFLQTHIRDARGRSMHPLRLLAFFDELFLRQSGLAERRPSMLPLVVRSRDAISAERIENAQQLATTVDADLHINPDRIVRLVRHLPEFDIATAAHADDTRAILEAVRDNPTTPAPLHDLLALLLNHEWAMIPMQQLIPCRDFNRELIDSRYSAGNQGQSGAFKAFDAAESYFLDTPAPTVPYDAPSPTRLVNLLRRMQATEQELQFAPHNGAPVGNQPPAMAPAASSDEVAAKTARALETVQRAFQNDPFLHNALVALRLVFRCTSAADAQRAEDRDQHSIEIRIAYRDAVVVYLHNHELASGFTEVQLQKAIETFLTPDRSRIGYHYLQELHDALTAFAVGDGNRQPLVDEHTLHAADADLESQIKQLENQYRTGDAAAAEPLQYCRAADDMLQQLFKLLPKLRDAITGPRPHDRDSRIARLRILREIYETLGNTVIGTPLALWHTSPLYKHTESALLQRFRNIVNNMYGCTVHATYDLLTHALEDEMNRGETVIDLGNAYAPLDQQAAHAAGQAVNALEPPTIAANNQRALAAASSSVVVHQTAEIDNDGDDLAMSSDAFCLLPPEPPAEMIVDHTSAQQDAVASSSTPPPPPDQHPLDFTPHSPGMFEVLHPDQGALDTQMPTEIPFAVHDNHVVVVDDDGNNVDLFGLGSSQPIGGRLSTIARKRAERLDDLLAAIERNPSSVSRIVALFRRLPLMRYLHATLTSNTLNRQLNTPVACALYYVLLQHALHWAVPAVGMKVLRQRRLAAPFLLSYYVNEHTLRYDVAERALELPVVCTQQPPRHTLFWHDDSQSGIVQLTRPSRALRTLEFITTDSHQSFTLQPQDDDGLLYAFDSKHTASGDGVASLTVELTRTAHNTLLLVGITQARDAVDPLVPWQVLVARRQRRSRRGWPQWVELVRSDAKAMPLGVDIAALSRGTNQQLGAAAVRELSRRGIAQVHYHHTGGANTSVYSTGVMDVTRTLHVYEPSALERVNCAPWAISIEPPLDIADVKDAPLLLDVGGQCVLHVLASANAQQSLAMQVPLRRHAGATLVPALVFGQ